MYVRIDPATPKHLIVRDLAARADAAGVDLSVSKIRWFAERIRRGIYDPELVPVLQYADTTGETAVNKVMFEQLHRSLQQ